MASSTGYSFFFLVVGDLEESEQEARLSLSWGILKWLRFRLLIHCHCSSIIEVISAAVTAFLPYLGAKESLIDET